MVASLIGGSGITTNAGGSLYNVAKTNQSEPSNCGIDFDNPLTNNEISLFYAVFNPTPTPILNFSEGNLISSPLDNVVQSGITEEVMRTALNSRFLDQMNTQGFLNLISKSNPQIIEILGDHLNENCEVKIIDFVSESMGIMNHKLSFYIYDKVKNVYTEFMQLVFNNDNINVYFFLERRTMINYTIEQPEFNEYQGLNVILQVKFFYDQMSYPQYYLKRYNTNNPRGRILKAEDFRALVNDSGEIETNPGYEDTYREFLVRMMDLTAYQFPNLSRYLLENYIRDSKDSFTIRYRINSDGLYTFYFLYTYGDDTYYLGEYSAIGNPLLTDDPFLQAFFKTRNGDARGREA